MIQSIIAGVVALVITVGVLFSPIPQLINKTEDISLGGTNPVAGTNYYLAGSGVASSDTSIVLTSLTIPQTGRELQDSDFSTTFYATLEPGSRTKQEIVSCTTVTQNANDTATLSGCSRGLLPFTPFTASSTYAFAHGGGTTLVFSNAPQFYEEFAAIGNDEIITGSWSFPEPSTASNTVNLDYANTNFLNKSTTTLQTVSASTTFSGNVTSTGALEVGGQMDVVGQSYFTLAPITNDTPDAGNELVNKTYADGLAIAGSPDSSTTTKGIGRVSVDPASSTDPVFVGLNDPRLDGATTSVMLPHPVAAIRYGGGGENNPISNTVLSASTTMYSTMYYLPFAMTANYFSLGINATTTPGDFNIGLYDENGTKLYSEIISATTTGDKTIGLSSAWALTPGNYYLNVIVTSTSNLTFDTYLIGSASASVLNPAGQPILVGYSTETGGTLPATFDETTLTATTSGALFFRLDE